MREHTFHPACLLFPRLGEAELRELTDDIRQNGLLNPIITLNGQILDGRNRLEACGIAGVQPRFVEWDGAGSPVEWAISQNLVRRHLTSSQRAVVAFGLLPLLEAEAKQRQRLSQGRGKKGAKNGATSSANGKASEIAARVARSNARYVEAVKSIHALAPELIDEIRNGALAVPDAAELAKLPTIYRNRAMDLAKQGGRKRKMYRIIRQVQLEARRCLEGSERPKFPGGTVTIWCGDCVKLTECLKPGSVSVVVTSPPLNVGVPYDCYRDDRPEEEYLEWLATVFQTIKNLLRHDGSFFLNVGSTRHKPWTAMRVAQVAGQFFVLQNEIVWIKAVSVEGRSHGHFSPVRGNHYLNPAFESIFHFTKNGDVQLDRLAVGVPFQHPANLLRNRAEENLRCGGDVWYLPHKTVHYQADRGGHPCVFPVELPERCIKLHGVRKDTLVLDPFLGSGSTLVAAARLGVVGIGVDLSPVYCAAAERRVALEVRTVREPERGWHRLLIGRRRNTGRVAAYKRQDLSGPRSGRIGSVFFWK